MTWTVDDGERRVDDARQRVVTGERREDDWEPEWMIGSQSGWGEAEGG